MSDAAFDAPLDQPPREQVERAEAKFHEFLKDAPETRTQRRTIGEAAHEAVTAVKRAYQAGGKLLGLPVGIRLIEDNFGGLQAPDYIELRARRLKRRNRLDLLNVDHLQLMRSPRELRPQNRLQQITEITMRTKALAKELHVPVLLLPQLNRASKRADSKVLQLSDLRDSGSIEQDTDSILYLYR